MKRVIDIITVNITILLSNYHLLYPVLVLCSLTDDKANTHSSTDRSSDAVSISVRESTKVILYHKEES